MTVTPRRAVQACVFVALTAGMCVGRLRRELERLPETRHPLGF